MPARVLLLDDDVEVAQVFGELLTLHGYTVTVCYSARRALVCLATADFDVILTDYHMPIMNGCEFYRLATRLKPELARRIIFFTGDPFQDDTLAFLDSTANPVLTKPLDFRTVERAVAQVLQAYRLR
jgi:CheY-like chemotaxis protein